VYNYIGLEPDWT